MRLREHPEKREKKPLEEAKKGNGKANGEKCKN